LLLLLLALSVLLLAARVLLLVLLVVPMVLGVRWQPITQDAAHKAASTRVADLALPRRWRRHAACKHRCAAVTWSSLSVLYVVQQKSRKAHNEERRLSH
jgi:hypothetical protein